MLNRDIIAGIIGKGFADKVDETVINVSNEISFTRREMVEQLGCANFIAATKLSKVLRRLRIEKIHQLAKTDPFSLARAKGVGEASIFVVMCILDFKGYDVSKWWHWDGNEAKFSSFKAHAIRHSSRRKHEV